MVSNEYIKINNKNLQGILFFNLALNDDAFKPATTTSAGFDDSFDNKAGFGDESFGDKWGNDDKWNDPFGATAAANDPFAGSNNETSTKDVRLLNEVKF